MLLYIKPLFVHMCTFHLWGSWVWLLHGAIFATFKSQFCVRQLHV